MERRLINYLPPIMQELREFKALMEAEQAQTELLYDYIDKVYNNQFVSDADEYGVSRWEKILKISPKATETLDSRKVNIIAKLNERLPYTIRTLRSQLETICGKDNFTAKADNDNYLLAVRIFNTGNGAYFNINDMLKRMIPANLVINMVIQIDLPASFVDIYNRKGKVSTFHKTTIGWDLFYNAGMTADIGITTGVQIYRHTVLG